MANKGAVKLRIDMLRRRRLSAGATQLGLLGLACRGVSTVLLLLLRKESLSARSPPDGAGRGGATSEEMNTPADDGCFGVQELQDAVGRTDGRR